MGNMAEDLTKLRGKFSLFEEESVGVEIEEDALADMVTKGKLCLVGKLITNRVVGKEVIKYNLRRGWTLLA
jgi:hypothetical protein